MDHLNRDISTLESFEIILVDLGRPRKELRVKVTNDANRTYFSCPAWESFCDRYELDPGRKFILLLDNQFHTTYFQFKHLENTSSSDSEELPPATLADMACVSEISNSTSS